eukprot:scaffold16193_cov66-Cyclotella_meneghiniana.AAC.2
MLVAVKDALLFKTLKRGFVISTHCDGLSDSSETAKMPGQLCLKFVFKNQPFKTIVCLLIFASGNEWPSR